MKTHTTTFGNRESMKFLRFKEGMNETVRGRARAEIRTAEMALLNDEMLKDDNEISRRREAVSLPF